jgi:hypothetical protein
MSITMNLWISSRSCSLVLEQDTDRCSHHLLSLSLESKLHLAPLKKDDIQVRATS